MIVKEAIFGNPWHGKLAAGSIELVSGTPVTDITVDGVEFPVQTVTGNLGDTRYHFAPADRLTPDTPTAVSALGGKFEADFIIYSDSMRYTPLTTDAIFESNGFLLWDTASERWRKMQCYLQGSNLIGYGSRPPEGTSVATWSMIRWTPVFGAFGGAPASPASSAIDSGNVGYTYKWDPFFRKVTRGWDWKINCSLTFDASMDGKQILASVIGYPEGSYPSPVMGSERICAVHSFTLDDTGENILSGPTEVLPDEIKSTMYWACEHDGVPYLLEWTDGAPPGYKYYNYLQPVACTFSGHYENSASIRILAAHDGAGDAKIMYLRDVDNYDVSGSFTAGAKLGVGYEGLVEVGYDLPDPPAEAAGVPAASESTYDVDGSSAELWWTDPIEDSDFTYPLEVNDQTVSMTKDLVNDRALRVVDELGDVLHEWTDPGMLAAFPAAIGWKRITNNVVSLEYGGQSIARVGPGAVDATVMDLPVYASFNPRTGVVVSSASPVGFV